MKSATVVRKKTSDVVCPDRRYCINFQEGCKIQQSCLPKAKNDPESVFYICMFSEITEKGRVDYASNFFVFHENLFIRSGGDKARMERILDDVVDSLHQRKELNVA